MGKSAGFGVLCNNVSFYGTAECLASEGNVAADGKVSLLPFRFRFASVECRTPQRFFGVNTMAPHRLPNYVRAHRKRLSFSQGEIARLLGLKNAAKVSRHECFTHEPAFYTALAYLVIFQKPAHDVFTGSYHKIGRKVASRASLLLAELDKMKPSKRNARKKEELKLIISLYRKP